MQKHITAVGVLRIGSGIVGIITAGLVLVFTVGIGLLAYNLEGEEEAFAVLSAVGILIAVVVFALAAASIICGVGVLRYKNWARFCAMVLSVIDFFNVPLGTALGIYCIWALAQDDTARLFGSREAPRTV